MTATVAGILLHGDHASRPAASAPPVGSIYSCSDHSLAYYTNGSSWSTWASFAGTGSVATDTIWNAAGDLAVGTGSDTATRLGIGATNGMAVQRVAGAVAWALPPGYEFDYVQRTSDLNITQTTEGAADTIVTGASVTYDGSTIVLVEFFATWEPNPAANSSINLALYDAIGGGGAASIGIWGTDSNSAPSGTNPSRHVLRSAYRFTPSAAAHVLSVRAYVGSGTGVIRAGAAGSGARMPAFMRVSKVS